MSSKVNNALFELIHSMSKSEKRYFKLMSSRHTIGDENNYVRLFDFIDKQLEYNEEDLFLNFKGEAFLNRFSITKKRLYDHILTALDSFHSSSSIDAQLDKQIHSADILFEKSLYDQSRRVLRSAEKLALKHEKQETLLRILKKQKRLMETNGYLGVSECSLTELKQKESKIIQSIKQFNELWMLKSELFSQLSSKGVARSKEEGEVFNRICSQLLKPVDLSDARLESKYLYHHTLSAYNYAVSELEHSYKHLQQIVLLFDEDPKMSTIEANKRVSVLTNAIYVCDKLGFYRDSTNFLNQLKALASKLDLSEDLTIKLFSSISSIELSTLLRKGHFDDAEKKLEEVSVGLEKYGEKIIPVRRAFLAFKMAVTHMGSGDYQQALKWVNRILNDNELDKTEDIIGFTQLVDLLIHIELNNSKLLPYSFKNTQRFFKTRNRLYSFEKIVLNFIGKLIKANDPIEIKDLWEQLYHELDQTADEKFQSVALEYFDFKSWAESKLKRKSFDLIVKEKYKSTIRTAS